MGEPIRPVGKEEMERNLELLRETVKDLERLTAQLLAMALLAAEESADRTNDV